MVLRALSKKANQWLGPFLLKQGIKARFAVARGVIVDNPALDGVFFVTAAQKLIQIEVHEAAKEAVKKAGDYQSGMSDDEVYRRDHESQIRVGVLESYLRPALVPRERWADVQKWQFHARLIKWARTEFLAARHGGAIRSALHSYPALRKSPQLQSAPNRGVVATLLFEKEPDPSDAGLSTTFKVPTTAILTKAFDMQNWKTTKDLSTSRSDLKRIATKLGGEVVELRGGAVCFAGVPPETDLSSLSLEEILEVAGGHVTQCGAFNAICEDAGIYQFWTREYVSHLGRYLRSRLSHDRETYIVDVGAGDGLLAELLREHFDKDKGNVVIKPTRQSKRVQPHRRRSGPPTPTIIATDNGSWNISERAEVEELSVEEAIAKYTRKTAEDAFNGNFASRKKKVIVLCSWMPMNEDWSSIFRSHEVDEYVLIGECDDGQCGDNWETWGNPNSLVDDFDDELEVASSEEDSTPSLTSTKIKLPRIPYELDGYVRKDLDELAPFQFSRFDCKHSKLGRTVSFRRAN